MTVCIRCLRAKPQTADTDCDRLKQPTRFTAVLGFCFGCNRNVSFLFYFGLISSVRTALYCGTNRHTIAVKWVNEAWNNYRRQHAIDRLGDVVALIPPANL